MRKLDSNSSKRRQSYDEYLRLATLLEAQQPLSEPDDQIAWAAERFFIISHQVSELLLSQVLSDIDQAHSAAESPGGGSEARSLLTRAASTTLMLSRTMDELMVCCPRDAFLRFRERLVGMSAGESKQFRAFLEHGEEGNPKIVAIRDSLEGAICGAFSRTQAPGICRHEECAAAASLKVLVEGIHLWRRFHIVVVKSFIGDSEGTGGTTGVDFLARRMSDCRENVNNGWSGGVAMRCAETYDVPEIDDVRRQLRNLRRDLSQIVAVY